ncbi:AAA family ATPase [Salisediminibacterium beveridgei]|nr:AAA family ATPase [Salisediminibacterium beveridgei]
MTEKMGRVIAVCGAKGGIGKTLISVNLAVALGKTNLDVAIVDGDLQFGDVSLSMDLQPEDSIKELVEDQGMAKPNTVMRYLTEHASGVRVLPAPERPEFAEMVTTDAMKVVLNDLKRSHDYIIIDNGIGLLDLTVETMEMADDILIVTNLEMSALKNTRLMLETMKELNYRDKTSLVVNRFTMESLMKGEEIPEMLGFEDAHFLPNNYKIASQSLNLGLPFVISQSKSDLAKAVFKMAQAINQPLDQNEEHQPKRNMTAKPEKPSFFKKWLTENG